MTNICIFGDSITWGACDLQKGGWAERLKNYYSQKTDYDVSVYNLGIQGENSTMLLKRLVNEAFIRKPNIIMVAIGTNDYSSSKNTGLTTTNTKKFEQNIINIHKCAKKFTTNIILIGLTNIIEKKTTPLSYNRNKYHYLKNAIKYNLLLEDICRKNRIKFIPIFDLLTSKEISEDGLHPNSKGHEKIFNKVKDYLKITRFKN